jgi:iron complex outermembrane receptor protein
VKRWLAILLLMPAIATAGSLEALTAADVPALLAPPPHGERLIALWALDCAYCEPNLQALARLQQAHPQAIELVTVATDDMAHRSAIEKRLQAAGVSAWPSRAYADATPERLNYLIDPDWGGETPHLLVIRADGSHVGYSGELTAKQLQALAPEP